MGSGDENGIRASTTNKLNAPTLPRSQGLQAGENPGHGNEVAPIIVTIATPLGFKPRPHWWKGSALTAALFLCQPFYSQWPIYE